MANPSKKKPRRSPPPPPDSRSPSPPSGPENPLAVALDPPDSRSPSQPSSQENPLAVAAGSSATETTTKRSGSPTPSPSPPSSPASASGSLASDLCSISETSYESPSPVETSPPRKPNAERGSTSGNPTGIGTSSKEEPNKFIGFIQQLRRRFRDLMDSDAKGTQELKDLPEAKGAFLRKAAQSAAEFIVLAMDAHIGHILLLSAFQGGSTSSAVNPFASDHLADDSSLSRPGSSISSFYPQPQEAAKPTAEQGFTSSTNPTDSDRSCTASKEYMPCDSTRKMEEVVNKRNGILKGLADVKKETEDLLARESLIEPEEFEGCLQQLRRRLKELKDSSVEGSEKLEELQAGNEAFSREAAQAAAKLLVMAVEAQINWLLLL